MGQDFITLNLESRAGGDLDGEKTHGDLRIGQRSGVQGAQFRKCAQ